MTTKEKKEAKLYADEFNPHKAFRSFWRLPRQIVQLEGLSMGAKILYGVLATRAGEYGTSHISRESLKKHLGGPSFKTIYNWQRELEDAHLLRVHQKGRGLPNNYYFLRTVLLGNVDDWKADQEIQCVYRGPQVEKGTLMTVSAARELYQEDLSSWYQKRIGGEEIAFPKPCWRVNRNEFNQYKKSQEQRVLAFFEGA